MILPHTFIAQTHTYQVEGRYCLATSDVIDLNGLCQMDQIPAETLRRASYRGTCLHSAIEAYEQGKDWQAHFPEEFMDYLDGWFAFRDSTSIQIVGPHETPYVYLHEGTDHAIGATIDFRFLYQGDLWIGDLKSIYPLSGKALKQKQLAWRLQTQSYVEATQLDEQFLAPLKYEAIRRAVVHIHPKLKGGYAVHEFHADDSYLWDSAVRIAMAKVAVGIQPSRKEVDLRTDLRMSIEAHA